MDGRTYHALRVMLTPAWVPAILVKRPVSWIFSFLLACYVLVRIVLRVRGQLRWLGWLGIRETLPEPPPAVKVAPEHLDGALAGLYVDTRRLRIALIEARRSLMRVAVTDPDAPFGRVRAAQYRRTVMQSFSEINAWLREIRELDQHAAAGLTDMHLGSEPIEQLRDALRAHWRAVARARALEPFALADLLAVQRTLESLDDELLAIERGLERLGDHPYRDRDHGRDRDRDPLATAEAV